MQNRRNFLKQASLMLAGGLVAPQLLSSCGGKSGQAAATASESSKYIGLQLYSLRDLVKEEGIQKTENNLIYIGKPLEFNEVHFLSGLRELEEAAMNESLNVKQIVSEIVPTYHIRQEDLKRDEAVNKELRELGKISHEKPVMED